jgi:hypothetical protein
MQHHGPGHVSSENSDWDRVTCGLLLANRLGPSSPAVADGGAGGQRGLRRGACHFRPGRSSSDGVHSNTGSTDFGVSKAVFNAVDYFTWIRLMRWTRAKYASRIGLSMKELRRRFCGQGWKFVYNGVVFTGASGVAVTRHRHRGSNIPTSWTPKPAAADTGS